MNSSLARKYWMAISGLFLIVFLAQHFSINFLSVISKDAFNEVSHFMGTNPMVQFLLQPVLMAGVMFHFIMGFILELKNRQSRPVKYAAFNPAANSSWMSRNMIVSGLMVLLFLALHFYDFWIPEINIKYIQGDTSGLLHDGNGYRYYEELVHKFTDPVRVALYVLSFLFLSLHLLHGFQSAFQSVGARHPKYYPTIQKVGTLYAVAIPVGFALIALYHFFTH
jgi:succinate dehydrogenase / fumarate reductase cytochrome b subunit